MKIINEGEKIPNGFYLKFGIYHERDKWKRETQCTFGRDGLVESICSYEVPAGTAWNWATFGFRLWKLHCFYRIRPWTTNIGPKLEII